MSVKKVNGYQVILLQQQHFLIVWLLQAAAKVHTVTQLYSLRLQTHGIYGIYNPKALSSTLILLVHCSPGPLGYKFCRLLGFEV